MNFKSELLKLKMGHKYIIGCDEVGRGCLAGPVVAAAVVFDPQILDLKSYILNFKVVKDSKKLTALKREELSLKIKQYALAWSIAEASSQAIDKINIHNASLLAMRRAVEGLSVRHCEECIRRGNLNTDNDKLFLFVDGKFIIPKFDVKQESIIGGDNKVLSIAAASIIAKVYRDQLMTEFDKQYPNYNFSQHKGYGTEHHRTMVAKHGLSPIHRISFCKNILNLF
jgi:ribonuclease HII